MSWSIEHRLVVNCLLIWQALKMEESGSNRKIQNVHLPSLCYYIVKNEYIRTCIFSVYIIVWVYCCYCNIDTQDPYVACHGCVCPLILSSNESTWKLNGERLHWLLNGRHKDVGPSGRGGEVYTATLHRCRRKLVHSLISRLVQILELLITMLWSYVVVSWCTVGACD